MSALRGQTVYILTQSYDDHDSPYPRVYTDLEDAKLVGLGDAQEFKDEEPYEAPEPIEKYAARWSWQPSSFMLAYLLDETGHITEKKERVITEWELDPGWGDSGFCFIITKVTIQ